MSAEVLRRAAVLMRERAERANEGPWGWARSPLANGAYDILAVPAGEQEFGLGRDFTRGDAIHIASWHPAVALAVADWLEATAREFDAFGLVGQPFQVADDHPRDGRRTAALAVAAAYLGDQS